MARPIATLVLILAGLCARPATAQVDPTRRRLIELGYDRPFVGPTPLNAYIFYYANEPGFLRKDANLRLALAPTYLDTELGLKDFVGENVDLGLDLAGGGFADSYYEVRQGHYFKEESFEGYGGTVGASLYTLLNPQGRFPINAVLRMNAHEAVYAKSSQTDRQFALPADHLEEHLRVGARFGGQPPRLRPMRAAELSLWYEGILRDHAGDYGFGDRTMTRQPDYFWTRSLINFMQGQRRYFEAEFQAGGSADADRISGYKLGGQLPFTGEFSLQVPGYYTGELSAKRYALFGGAYGFPIMPEDLLWCRLFAATANVTYLPGEEQPRPWNTGAGAGFRLESPGRAWLLEFDYAHGFDALRSGSRGSDAVVVLTQIDLQALKKQAGIQPARRPAPSQLPGLQSLGDLFR